MNFLKISYSKKSLNYCFSLNSLIYLWEDIIKVHRMVSNIFLLCLSVHVKCICQHYFKNQNVEMYQHCLFMNYCPDQPVVLSQLRSILLCTATFIPNTFEGKRH